VIDQAQVGESQFLGHENQALPARPFFFFQPQEMTQQALTDIADIGRAIA